MVGQVGVPRVADHAAVRLAVPGVADQLIVVNADARPEHAHGGQDPAAVQRAAQVGQQVREHPIMVGDVTQVVHAQRLPGQPAHAAGAVAPRDPRPERQFVGAEGQVAPVRLGLPLP